MKYLLLFLTIFSAHLAAAQSSLPVIKATSQKATIKDGEYLDKGAWTLSPQIKPDVYTADRSHKAKWVVFYTDIDSIKVKVKPGTRFDFVVLLNGKDSCFTQIASAIPPVEKLTENIISHDSIPFILTKHNAIAVKALVNSTDTVLLHFDTGSWDFRLTKEAIIKKTSLLSNQPDALAGKVKPNYNKLNKVSKIQLAGLTFTNPEWEPTDVTAHDMDGRFGWNLFEGKTVEINYDNSNIIIHSKPIKIPKGYAKSNFEIKHSFMIVKGDLEVNKEKYPGDFLMDTGSELAIILDSAWAAKYNLAKNLKLIKSTVLRNPRGVAFEIKIVNAPLFSINGFGLANVPASILAGRNPAGFEVNNLGSGFLKRFNIIMDFKHDKIYLKPNKLSQEKYNENS